MLSLTVTLLCLCLPGIFAENGPKEVRQALALDNRSGTVGCTYNGRTYGEGQTWDDGCKQSCTCNNANAGFYSCGAVCLNWDSLPSSCHMEGVPPGLCCQQPKCPANIVIQIPSAYSSQYPGYRYV